jgi:membrane protease YdiL (CAAX protease family)
VSTSPPPKPPSPQGWPLWTAFGGLLGGWLGGSVLGALVYAIAAANGHDAGDAPIGYDLAANLLLDACLIAAAIGFARLSGRVTPATFGLRPTPIGRALLWTIVGYVSYLVLSAIWLGITNAQNEQDDITTTLKDDPGTVTVAGLAVFAVVIAPIVEEVFFRGFVFTAMRAKLNVPLAAVVSGTMFGAVHAFGSPWQFLVPLSILGTMLCLVYWKTGSLYPCIALHAINNSVALSTALDWTWQIPLLIAGSLAVIAAIVLPVARLAGRRPAPA